MRLPEALAACEAALKVDRNNTDAHLLRIQVLLDLKHFDDVTGSCDVLLESGKTSAALYELRGLARAGLKDFAGAIEDHTQAIALEPGQARLFLRRGDLYLVSDAPKLAKHDFEEAVRLDPSSGDALSGRAAALVRLGKHREAVEDAEKALRLSAPTALRLYSAARIYARAAAVAAAQVRSSARESASLVEQYQDRGTALLREAIKKLPSGERAAFWRDVVQGDPDPAMNALRRRLRSADRDSQATPAPEAAMTSPDKRRKNPGFPDRRLLRRRRQPTRPAEYFGTSFQFRPRLEMMEDRTLLSTFLVSTTADSGAGSLRQAILDSNAATTGTNTIDFAIPGPGRADDRAAFAPAGDHEFRADRRLFAAGLRRHAADRAERQPARQRRRPDDHRLGRDRPRPGHRQLLPGRRHSHHGNRRNGRLDLWQLPRHRSDRHAGRAQRIWRRNRRGSQRQPHRHQRRRRQ